MNRPLKFRVWDKELNKFVTGYDIDCGMWREVYSDPPAIFFEGLKYLQEDERYIIQQYTGLTDKNGKEIFEGDIVKYQLNKPIDRVGTVEYSCYYNGWCITDSKCYPASEFGVYSLVSPFMSFNHVEVIGNIFENSELLK